MSQTEFLRDALPDLLFGLPGQRPGGLVLSVLLAVAGSGLGFLIAVGIGSALDTRSRMIRRLAGAYVHVFRSIPLVLLVLLVHQLLARRGATPLVSAIVALVLYESAYQADIIRTGLGAVPANLVDSTRLLGSSRWETYRLVKLPYSLRVMQPAIAGQRITLFKDSSVVIIIGVADLTTTARLVLGGDVANAPHWLATYLTVGALYFTVAFGFSRLARRIEVRTHVGRLATSV